MMHHMRSQYRLVATLVVLFAVLAGTVLPALAATSSNTSAGNAGNGIKISPVHSDLTIKPGSSVTVDVYVTNVTAQTATYQIVGNDFIASGDESGNPALILEPDKSAPAHGLKQFIAPISNITVKPNEQKDVKVIVSIPANAPPGGYYGAIRVLPADVDLKNNTLSLSASVASLILVRVPGDLKEQVSIASLDARVDDHVHSIFTSKKGINGVIRFQNEGNVQEQPFGKLTVKDIRGKIVYSAEVNDTDPRGNVLPDSIRKFSVPLKNLSSLGKYTMEGNFGYASGQTLSASSTFYVIPIPVIVITLILLVLIIIAIFEAPRMLRRYKKRILRQAGRG